MPHVILHSDLNGFYASVECLHQLDIRDHPVAVCGQQELRHGIVLAKNELAKPYGVKTGDAVWQARQKCPDLVVVPPNFPLYMKFSHLARSLYAEYSPRIEPFGLDEAWIDLSGPGMTLDHGKEIADEIRHRMKEEIGLTVSIGVSWNKIFAKLGSDMKKPDATTLITPDDHRSSVWPLPASDLLYVGRATQRKLARVGITTIGGIATAPPLLLHTLLKKWGLYLHTFANGRDISPVMEATASAPVKSVGNSITAPHDLQNIDEVKLTLYMLADSVAERLRDHGFRCCTVQVSLRDTGLFWFDRQQKLARPTCLSGDLVDAALQLVEQHYAWQKPLRSIGLRACDLVPDTQPVQTSLLTDEEQQRKQETLEQTIDTLRRRYGHFAVQRGVLLCDPSIGRIHPKEDHTIHPVGYFANGAL